MRRYNDSITNTADVIDSRDVIARIETLTEARDSHECECHSCDGSGHSDEDTECLTCDGTGHESDTESSRSDWAIENSGDAEELAALIVLAMEGENSAGDWSGGEGLIRDSYFVEYAQQTAEDIGAIPRDLSWPSCHIDWDAAADALKQDYSSIDFDGVEYWVRS